MKPTIDKSRVMRRAWNIFRGNNPCSGNFIESLRRAWFVERDTVRFAKENTGRERVALESASRASVNLPVDYLQGAANYYSEAPHGTYFGD